MHLVTLLSLPFYLYKKRGIFMQLFPNLFSPIQIGKTTVKNRIFMPPLSTNLADKGYVTDALIEHYANRAKGGVGLIITEVTTVEPIYTYLPGDMSIYDDSYIPSLLYTTPSPRDLSTTRMPSSA